MDVYEQKPGTRIKEWDLGENPEALIEATAESPVMYAWLGTEPRAAHPFNVYGDIASQGKALRDTFELNRERIPALAARVVERGLDTVLGYGLGTSQYAAKTALAAFWSYAGYAAWALDSLEYVGSSQPIDFERTVALAYSGSGSTVDTIRAARAMKERGAFQIAFTSVAGSPLTADCDETVVCAGGFDTGGSDTFHYTTRVAASVWLALEIGAQRDPHARGWNALRTRLFALPDKLDRLFEGISARADALATRYRDVRSVFVVGSGAGEALAEELTLKYDEMSHIPAKAMCPGRHLHGALGTTAPEILTIVVAPLDDPNYAALRDVAQVTRMLKTPSIALVSERDRAVASEVDDVFRLPEREPILFPLLAILPGQLLAYFAGVAQGDVNPDCQRANIARYARVWHWLFPKGAH
jgi:glucosamine--fructose-6-phosphate aminotransferase (isomerizing)